MDTRYAELERRVQMDDRDAFAPYKQERARRGLFTPTRVDDHLLGDSFLYENLVVDGRPYDLVQGNEWLEEGICRTWDGWKNNNTPITNVKIEAAIKLGWYSLRERSAFRSDLKHYTTAHLANDTYSPLYGKFIYEIGTRATLEEYTLNGTIGTRELTVPMLRANSMILAWEQPEKTFRATKKTHIFLQELFGAEPSQVVAAFQYLAKRTDDGHLREVRLLTPSINSREYRPDWPLVLERGNGRFDIDCHGIIDSNKRAFGWRSYAKAD